MRCACSDEQLARRKRSQIKIRDLADTMPQSDIRFEFSPEEFTDSDFDFVLELCEAVFETW